MILFLGVLAIIGALKGETRILILQILLIIIATSILDLIIAYIKKKKFLFPSSAIISGLFIGGILAPNQKFYVYLTAVIVTILSKHLIKINKKHIFNPAAFGLIFVSILFRTSLNWWIDSLVWLVLIFGLFMAYKMRRFHLILSFVIPFEVLMLIYTIINKLTFGHLLLINLFLVFFMLVEPVTSPIKKNSRIIFGIIAAIAAFILFHYLPAYDPFLTSLLIANLFIPLFNKKMI